jgi:hypothetical protein
MPKVYRLWLANYVAPYFYGASGRILTGEEENGVTDSDGARIAREPHRHHLIRVEGGVPRR